MRPVKLTVAGLVVVAAALIATLVYQSGSSLARSLNHSRVPRAQAVVPQAPPRSAPSSDTVPGGELGRATTTGNGGVTRADGALPDGVTAFDDVFPGIANLDPNLVQALRNATKDAADNGIDLTINSGWRSAKYQDALLKAAVSQYGSLQEAERWVATADTSPHVSGEAVDIGSAAATTWLSKHGAAYGLCQIYRNEPWHYELRPDANAHGCPPMYADPTRDPRMQK